MVKLLWRKGRANPPTDVGGFACLSSAARRLWRGRLLETVHRRRERVDAVADPSRRRLRGLVGAEGLVGLLISGRGPGVHGGKMRVHLGDSLVIIGRGAGAEAQAA